MATADNIARILERMPQANVLCIGDIMLDRYITGDAARLSPEAPVPVMEGEREEIMLGGVGNVARNIAGLGAQAAMCAAVGGDYAAHEIGELLALEKGIAPMLAGDMSRSTTEKTRYIVAGQQVMRKDRETTRPISEEGQRIIIDFALMRMDGCGALVLSDYDKGVVTPRICRVLIAAARDKGIPVFVDPKGKTWGHFRHATVFKPNLKELAAMSGRAAYGAEDVIEYDAARLCFENDFKFVLVTMGSAGMVLCDAQGKVAHFPAEKREVYDVSGAGDTVIAALATAFAAGASITTACQIASMAAGIAVSKRGTYAVTARDISALLLTARSESANIKIMGLTELLIHCAYWKAGGLKVGLTNGCFDILHAGHVHLLAEARKRCDRLIVGINSDASVRALKGEGRPVIGDVDRAQVIAAMECVDAVVVFHEDMPLNLISALKPDIVMKGSDYTKQQVKGWEMVEEYGGKVEIVPSLQGHSTTRIIEKAMRGSSRLEQ